MEFDKWLAIGLLGQFFFFSRFLVQWIASEIRRESVIPLSFWYLSILGSIFLLAYALQKRDPVFILGQSVGFIVYFRNLALIGKVRSSSRESSIKQKELELERILLELNNLKKSDSSDH